MDKRYVHKIDIREYIDLRDQRDLYAEYSKWKRIITRFLRENNTQWIFINHKFYIEDQQLLLKFKLIHG